MNLGGITSKLTSKADMIGFIAGLGLGAGTGFDTLTQVFNNAMSGNIHFPDIQGLIQSIATNPATKSGITGIIVGEVISGLNLFGTGKYGKALSKASTGYVKGGAVLQTLWYATNSNKGSNPASPNFNPNWNNNAKPVSQVLAEYNY